MKVFISQLMLGKTKEEIFEDRKRIEKYIRAMYKEPIEIIDSYITEEIPETVTAPGVWYTAKSLECMSKADLVFFSKDFGKGRGCTTEYNMVLQYHMEHDFEH